MLVGHFAVGLGAKRFAPELNLGLLFIACQLLDLIWPVLVLMGIERVSIDPMATKVVPLNFEYYPFSHSFVMAVVYSLCVGAAAGFVFKSKRVAVVLGLVTSSHWILDFMTHRPDLPFFLGDEKFGLGMWNSVILTVSIELSLFALGIYMFITSTELLSRKRKIWFWGLISFLLFVYTGNIIGIEADVDTPASMIAGPALSMWLIVLWAYLVDRNSKSITV